jgi:hypothetical protein
MTKSLRTASPSLKKFSVIQKAKVPAMDDSTHKLIHLIMETPANPYKDPILSPKELVEFQKQFHCRQFKGWSMPEAPVGYIKPSKHNLL